MDSLVKKFSEAKSDTEKVYILIRQSAALSDMDSLTASLNRSKLAYEIAKRSGSSMHITRAGLNLGTVYAQTGNNTEAVKCFTEVEDGVLAFNNPTLLRQLYMGKGRALSFLGNYPEALQNNLKALEIMQQTKDKRGEAGALNNIGIIYDYMGDKPKALKYYFNSVAIKKEVGDKRGMAVSYVNIGEIYQLLNKIDSAIYYFDESFRLGNEIKDNSILSLAYNNKGAIYLGTSEFEKALECFMNSLKIDAEAGDEFGVAINKINIGGIYAKLKKWNESEKYLKEGLEASRRIENLENEKMAYEAYSMLYEGKGDFKNSLLYYKKFKKLNDSIFSGENVKQFNDLKTQYEVDKKETELQLKAKEENIKHEQKLKQQRIISYSFLGGGVLILALLILSFRSNHQKKKANQIITQQKLLVDEKQKEILDSIHYAKRIQNSLLPSEKYIEKRLDDLIDKNKG